MTDFKSLEESAEHFKVRYEVAKNPVENLQEVLKTGRKVIVSRDQLVERLYPGEIPTETRIDSSGKLYIEVYRKHDSD